MVPGVSNERVTTTLVGVPNNPVDTQYAFDAVDPSALPAYAKELDAVPFYTNEPMQDEIGLDRRMALRKVGAYILRGGIETSYRKIKGFMPSTTSKDFSVRLFHFGFAVLMYNMWLLVDFLVQSSLNVESGTNHGSPLNDSVGTSRGGSASPYSNHSGHAVPE